MQYNENIERIKEVYDALGELRDKVIFVGGATVSLYADRETYDVRPTMDVDVVIEIWTHTEYAKVEEKLRSLGFQHDRESGILCRFKFGELIVDVMPLEESILGFNNRWYAKAYQHAMTVMIDTTHPVRIFAAPYFMASKLDAFNSRGKGDGRTSTDFEDIIFVLNNRSTIWTDLNEAHEEVYNYLKQTFTTLLNNLYLEEWIGGHLEFSEKSRVHYIIEGMQNFVAVKF